MSTHSPPHEHAHAGQTHAHPQAHAHPSTALLVAIYFALMGLLVLTVYVAEKVNMGSPWNFVAAALIAGVKTLLILVIFMHLKYSHKLTWLAAAAGFVFLALLIVMTLTDHFTRHIKERPPVPVEGRRAIQPGTMPA